MRAARACKGSRPNLRNRNSNQAEISRAVQKPENKLVFQILGQSEFFWRFYTTFCVIASNKPPWGIIKIIKEIGKNPLSPYPHSEFKTNRIDIRRDIMRASGARTRKSRLKKAEILEIFQKKANFRQNRTINR